MGYAEASTGFQALECLRRQSFSMTIVDLSMPGMSGLELIRRIKTELPSVTVLVLSMHAEEQYALRAFKAGAIVVPISPSSPPPTAMIGQSESDGLTPLNRDKMLQNGLWWILGRARRRVRR